MFSCSEGTKEDLESWAEDEGRSISNLIERIVMDAIAKRKKKTRNKNDEEEWPCDALSHIATIVFCTEAASELLGL